MSAPMRPVKYRGIEQDVWLSPPQLGEDTLAVLEKFGCIDVAKDPQQLELWARAGVIQDPALPPAEHTEGGKAKRKN